MIVRKKISVTNYNYCSNKINDDFNNYKIAVISDLHTNELGKGCCNLIEKMTEINPDIIITAGDMLSDNAKKMHVTYNLLNKLANKFNIYYGCGNHELKLYTNPRSSEKYREYCKKFKESGIQILNNSSIYINKGKSKIQLLGLNIDKKFYTKIWNKKQNMNDDYIESLIGKSPEASDEPDILSILIAHNPIYFKNYSNWGADIVLSGHVHGGMVVLPYIGGVISSSFELFPKYDFGEFKINNEATGHISTMYLTRGLGSHTIPLRINNNPEIMVITLNSCKNDI